MYDIHGNNNVTEVARFCGNEFPQNSTKTSTYTARVKFRSNADIQGKGFGIDFTASNYVSFSYLLPLVKPDLTNEVIRTMRNLFRTNGFFVSILDP